MSDLTHTPTLGILLRSSSDWSYWFTQFKFQALSKNVWERVNPDSSPNGNLQDHFANRPSFPRNLPTNAAEGTPNREPTTKQLAAYEAELARWKVIDNDYQVKATRLQHMYNWTMATVDARLLAPAMILLSTGEDQLLQALIKQIKSELAPTDSHTKELVRAEYRASLDTARQATVDPMTWFHEWNMVYMKAKAYALPEILGVLGTMDWLDAVGQKLAPDWAQRQKQDIIGAQVLGADVVGLEKISRVFSAILSKQGTRAYSSGVYATMGQSASNPPAKDRPNNQAPRTAHKCPCRNPTAKQHLWTPETCRVLLGAIGGSSTKLSPAKKSEIILRLHTRTFTELRATLAKDGLKIPLKESVSSASSVTPFPGGVIAALLDPTLLNYTPGVYSTVDFGVHPLSGSTILDNGAALHLVNSADLLEPGLFHLVKHLETVEAGTQAFPISGRGTRVLKKILNGACGALTEDLTLQDVAVVEGFHLNIISEARLQQKGVWYLGLDNTLRVGTLKESTLLASLTRNFNLTFVEYKPVTAYPTLAMTTMPSHKRSSWATHPRHDSEEL
ncbi:hypothetical protein EJ02DRAFT_427926 [Clathrospora elynae]|uniref:Uncharacterized protein n=1 Tax=Clathrospora elynae TaxID=706981 RepID=A0A6A5S5W6_9PLEO|nr:hypothetical protein EJ02DRAFT_427926 [Clathrospora elynae]